MDSHNELPSSVSTTLPQGSRSGRRSLPPTGANVLGPQHVLPSYPSSTLQFYYPPSFDAANYAHIPPSFPTLHSHPPVSGDFAHVLPSASQSYIPSLRQTPSIPSAENINTSHAPVPPFSDQRNNLDSHNSQRIQSISPIAFYDPQPIPTFAAPQPQPIPTFTAPQPVPLMNPVFHPHIPITHARLATNVPNSQISYVNPSLPSTKDVPLLTGRHDWGPWHSAVRTLILNTNLLGHIADDPLPGAIFDPGLWPTYPPVVHQRSSHAQLQSFTEWWSRNGLASHILTSCLSSSILGSLPIANERMGH